MDTQANAAARWWADLLCEAKPSEESAYHADGASVESAMPHTTAHAAIANAAIAERAVAGQMPEETHEDPRRVALSQQQVEAFEEALEHEIDHMLQDGLPHVLCVNGLWASRELCEAAQTCGIDSLHDRFPNSIIMRIFPNAVMVHTGSCAVVEIVWSDNKAI